MRAPERGNCPCVMCFSKGGQEAQTGSNQASDTTGKGKLREGAGVAVTQHVPQTLQWHVAGGGVQGVHQAALGSPSGICK